MKICLASSGGSAVTRGLIMSLGALALAAFLVGNHSHNVRPQGEGTQAPPPAVTVHSREAFSYFRSGLWLADLRTLAAVCRYLADPSLA